jgi:ferrous iron transport protein A
MPAPQPLANTLADLPKGTTAIFIAIQSGREAAGRLSSLGFTPGARISILQNYGHGPLVVSVRGSRVALGREEARRILIQPE